MQSRFEKGTFLIVAPGRKPEKSIKVKTNTFALAFTVSEMIRFEMFDHET